MNNFDLKWEVKKTVLHLDGQFTLKDIIFILKEKNIMTKENGDKVLNIISDILELPLIQRIPFSDKYFVLGSK